MSLYNIPIRYFQKTTSTPTPMPIITLYNFPSITLEKYIFLLKMDFLLNRNIITYDVFNRNYLWYVKNIDILLQNLISKNYIPDIDWNLYMLNIEKNLCKIKNKEKLEKDEKIELYIKKLRNKFFKHDSKIIPESLKNEILDTYDITDLIDESIRFNQANPEPVADSIDYDIDYDSDATITDNELDDDELDDDELDDDELDDDELLDGLYDNELDDELESHSIGIENYPILNTDEYRVSVDTDDEDDYKDVDDEDDYNDVEKDINLQSQIQIRQKRKYVRRTNHSIIDKTKKKRKYVKRTNYWLFSNK
jgi:hypothetical protein